MVPSPTISTRRGSVTVSPSQRRRHAQCAARCASPITSSVVRLLLPVTARMSDDEATGCPDRGGGTGPGESWRGGVAVRRELERRHLVADRVPARRVSVVPYLVTARGSAALVQLVRARPAPADAVRRRPGRDPKDTG